MNDDKVETVDWTTNDHVILLHGKPGMNQIDILVENCGRVNYADYNSTLLNSQRKGDISLLFTSVNERVIDNVFSASDSEIELQPNNRSVIENVFDSL